MRRKEKVGTDLSESTNFFYVQKMEI